MPSIDERIVSAVFDNAKFEAAVGVTMATLAKLDESLKNIGQANSLSDIQKAADKVTLEQPLSALDKLKAKFSGAGDTAAQGMSNIQNAGDKVTLEQPVNALGKVQAAASQVGARASEGFSGIESAANRVDLGGLSSSIETVASRFSILEGAAAVALGNIASQAVAKGAQFAKSFAIGPIQDGFSEYTTNLNSIQTILANTQSSGGNLESVNSALNDLNHYSDKTIYNFSEMARNIGTFTAAGVHLDTATQSIKGIANLAALSGSNSQQASTAMYQLSQAIAAGKVNLQDWNSVVNAGMGGEVFQKALFDTGKAMHTITNSPVGQTFEEWKKAGNSFRQSLSATQRSAQDGTAALTKAQKDGAQSVKDAQSQAAEDVTSAAKRVKDAQASQAEDVAAAAKRVTDAQESSAEAVTNAAQRVKDAQASAAESAKASAEKVKEAHKGVSDAAKTSSEDLKAAQAAQKTAFAQAAADVKSALDGVVEARKRLNDALKPPSEDELQAATDKLTTAQLDQADLAGAVTDAQTEQKRSAEDLATAKKRLAELPSGSTPEEIRAATRAVEDAQKRATDDADAVTRAVLKQNAATRDLHSAQKDLTDVQTKGTDQDQKVIDARDALTIATDKLKAVEVQAAKDKVAAEQKVTETRLKGLADQKKAAEDLAKAEKDQSETIKKGRAAIAKAEAEQAKTIIDAREKVAEAEKAQAKTITDSREKVAEAEKAQAKTIIDTRRRVATAEENAAERIKTARDAVEAKKGGGQGPPSWLTSDVLTTTLKQFTGDMTDAQLRAQGFTDEQIKAIQTQAKTAQDAATKVKTLGALFSTTREAIGSGWASTFQIIFGDFEESRKLFTGVSNVVGGFFNNMSNRRNDMLKEWKALGGRDALIGGLKAGFEALFAVLKPIGQAFHDIFTPTTGKSLAEMTKNFQHFMESVKPSPETIDNLRRTFRGLFAVLHIVWTVIKDVAGVLFDLVGVAGDGSGGFLKFTGSIGDMLVALDKALTKGGLLKTFFDGLSSILQVPVRLIGKLASAFFGLFDGADSSKADGLNQSLDGVRKTVTPLQSALDTLKTAWDGFVHILQQAKDLVSPWLDNIGAQMSSLGTILSNALGNLDFNKMLGVLQTGFIGGIFLVLRRAISGNSGKLGNALTGLNKVFGGLTGQLQAMQQKVKAQIIFEIAAAIGILAASTYVLSTIDPKRLASALTAMAVGLGELMGALKLMTSGAGKTAIITMPFLAAGLIGVAAATVIIAGAMKIFATMKWEDIAKGMVGIGGGLAAIGIGMKAIGPGALIQGPALIAIGIGLNIIALAVKQFAGMKWEDMAKGIAGVFGALIAVAVPMSTVGPSLILAGPGLIAVAIAMNIMAKAVAAFGALDPKQMVRGIIGIGGALVVLAGAIALIPPTVALQAAGLVILSGALIGISKAIEILGKLKVSTLVKGIASIAGVMTVLAIGLSAMSGTLLGSAALLVAAGALAILAPTLAFMGTLNWGTIIKGLAAIALVLGTLSIVGALASGGLVSLGISLLPLAGVLVLTAGAVFLFAKALALLGDSGAKGVAVMVTAITAFIALLPSLVISFAKGVVDTLGELAKLAPKVVEALGTILGTIIQFVIDQAPKLALAVGALVDAFVQVLVDNTPKLVSAGFTLLLNFLKGLDDNIGEVTTRVASIIINFLTALTDKAPELTAAGLNFLVAFLKGIADNIGKLVTAAIGLVTSFITAVVGKLPDVIGLGARLLLSFVGAMADHLLDAFNMGVKIIGHILSGLAKAIPDLLDKAVDIASKFVSAVAKGLLRLVNAGADALIAFINGLADTIRDKGPELRSAGWNLADAIIDGMVDGFSELGHKAIDGIEGLVGGLPGAAKKLLGIHSPSKVFMEIGKFTAEGLVVGLQNGTSNVATASGDLGDTAVSTLKKSMSKVGDALDAGIDSNPTITPILDLTHIRNGIDEINGISDLAPLAAQPSFALAASVSNETQKTMSTSTESGSASAAPVIKFEQTNVSPESLNPAEIYRQTQNQLSIAKRAIFGDRVEV